MNSTNKTVTFVPVTKKEVPTLCKLAQEIWEQHFTPIIGAEQVAYMLQNFQSPPAITEQLNNGFCYWLICLDQTPVGYTGVQAQDGKLFLSKLYLRKDQRKNGIASKAIRFLADFAKQRGLSAIWLTVNRYNTDTIAVYRHLGFLVLREEKKDIGNGFYMDDYIMEKPLNE